MRHVAGAIEGGANLGPLVAMLREEATRQDDIVSAHAPALSAPAAPTGREKRDG